MLNKPQSSTGCCTAIQTNGTASLATSPVSINPSSRAAAVAVLKTSLAGAVHTTTRTSTQPHNAPHTRHNTPLPLRNPVHPSPHIHLRGCMGQSQRRSRLCQALVPHQILWQPASAAGKSHPAHGTHPVPLAGPQDRRAPASIHQLAPPQRA